MNDDQPEPAPIVDDASPVPSQVPTSGDTASGSGAHARPHTEADATADGDAERTSGAADTHHATDSARDADDEREAAIDAKPDGKADGKANGKPGASTRDTLDLRPPQKRENSTDATRGEPLAVRARIRKDELETLLARTTADDVGTRADIERALASVADLLTGDTEHLSESTAAAINRWLEGAKHLGAKPPAATATAPAPGPARR